MRKNSNFIVQLFSPLAFSVIHISVCYFLSPIRLYSEELAPLPLGVHGESSPDLEQEKRNQDKDLSQLEKMALTGNSENQFHLALALLNVNGVKDLTRIRELLEKSANQNYIPAQSMLASCYASGKFGNGQQFDLAVKWYRSAAMAGDQDSEVMYGYYLVEGLGVTKNIPLGMSYLKLAASKGDVNAQTMLAHYKSYPPSENGKP